MEEPSLHVYQTIGCHVKNNEYIPISIVKPTRCNSVSNFFYFEMTLYMFRTVFPSIIRSSRLYIRQQVFVKQILLSACLQVYWPQAVSKPVWHIPLLCVQWKTPDDEQRNCPKHVEFYSKNKFDKLVHLVGFIIRTTGPFLDTKYHALFLVIIIIIIYKNFW